MVNVFMVGVRGSIMPLLGGWMTDVVGPKDPIFYGILLSIAGALMVLRPQSQEKRETAFI